MPHKYMHILIHLFDYYARGCFARCKSTKTIPIIEYNSLYLHYKIVSKNETE